MTKINKNELKKAVVLCFPDAETEKSLKNTAEKIRKATGYVSYYVFED